MRAKYIYDPQDLVMLLVMDFCFLCKDSNIYKVLKHSTMEWELNCQITSSLGPAIFKNRFLGRALRVSLDAASQAVEEPGKATRR